MMSVCKHKLSLQLKTTEKGRPEIVRKRITRQLDIFFNAEYELPVIVC